MTCMLGLLAALMWGCQGPNVPGIQAPVAAFSASPLSGLSPLVVRFDASAARDVDGVIAAYSWTFGDGGSGSGRTAAHTYAVTTGQTFTATLTVTDNDGLQNTASVGIVVEPPPDAGDDLPDVGFDWPFHYDAAGDDAANLNDEYVTIANFGAHGVDLSGWSLANDRGAVYVFPAGVWLGPAGRLTVHSGMGTNTATVLYWNAREPVWDDHTGTAVLYDADGVIVDLYEYASCSG